MYLDSISLSKFLSRYAKVYGVNLKKITHDEVKVLFPELKRATFQELKANKELVISGKVLLVNDGRKTIPYYAPELTDDLEEEMYLDREEVNDFEMNEEVSDCSDLSEYELRQLLRRKYNSYKNQINARRELESRGIRRARLCCGQCRQCAVYGSL